MTFKPCSTLRHLLTKVKTPISLEMKTGVIYEIPCSECDTIYIGETGRCLKKRIVEHRRAVKNCDRNNGVAVHAWDEGHSVNWEGARVRCNEPNMWKRKVLEAIHIKLQPLTSNLDCGLTMDSVWLPFLKHV